MDSTVVMSTRRESQANFDGMMVSALAYGALIMLYIQITQVMLRRPKRSGPTFWFIIIYASILFPLTTVAFAAKFKYAEALYLALPNFPGTMDDYWEVHSVDLTNIMSQACVTMIPWFGDGIMLYRLMVIWNYEWTVLVLPMLLYLTRIGLSIPILIGLTRPDANVARTTLYMTVFYCLCLSLNIVTSGMIIIRLYLMRHKAEKVLGTLQASLYNSAITMFVESGSFFTIWSMVYMISRTRHSWVQDIFLQPYSYIIAVTRMLIILRMAQGRAWSKDIITAADDGVLDWQVSSSSSGGLDMQGQMMAEQRLPKKFLENSFNSSKSTLHHSGRI